MKLQDNIASEFDHFADNYTEDMIKCVPHYQDLLLAIRDNLPRDIIPHKILDLGCGNGNTTQVLIDRFPDAMYTLVDASPEMISICRKRFEGLNIKYIQAYFQDWTFPSATYDIVAAGFALHHVGGTDKQNIFREIFGSLKPKGIFITSDLMISKSSEDHPALIHSWDVFVNSHYPPREKWDWIMEHYDAFDRPDDYKDQIAWLKDAGFDQVHIGWQEGYWINLVAERKE